MMSKNCWIAKLSNWFRAPSPAKVVFAALATVASMSLAESRGLAQDAPVPFPDLEKVQTVPFSGVDVETGPAGSQPIGLAQILKGEPSDPQIWASVDYLLWFTDSTPIPSMLTTGPGNVVGPSGLPGVLGQPGTQVLIGDSIGFTPASGVRINAGMWLDREHLFGVEGAYLLLPNRINNHTWTSSGAPGSMPLSIPYYNTQAGAQDTTGVALPGGFGGTANLTAQTSFQSAEVNILHRLGECNGFRFDGMIGYRWAELNEVLQYDTPSNLRALGNPREFFNPYDRFHSTSNLYAGQAGLRANKEWGRLGLTAWTKIGMGGMAQATKINGALYTNDYTGYTAIQAYPGGYYAQPTNSGYHSGTAFSVLPEIGLNGSIRLLECLKLNIGYTFLYMTNVVRPGDQISNGINPTQSPSFTGNPNSKLVGAPAPLYSSQSSDWWAHGLNFGLEFMW